MFNRLYLNDVSVIAAKEESGKNILHVAVKSSFQRAVIEGNQSGLADSVIRTAREIVVMERDKAAGEAKGSIYAHQCPACGAPVADSLDVKCGYCGSVLNSPKSEWIISDVIPESSYAAEIKGESFTVHGDPDIEDSLYSARDFAFNNVLVIFGADGSFELLAEVPANTTSTVWLPAAEDAAVFESNLPVEKVAGIEYLGYKEGCKVYAVGSGTYRFDVRPQR